MLERAKSQAHTRAPIRARLSILPMQSELIFKFTTLICRGPEAPSNIQTCSLVERGRGRGSKAKREYIRREEKPSVLCEISSSPESRPLLVAKVASIGSREESARRITGLIS